MKNRGRESEAPKGQPAPLSVTTELTATAYHEAGHAVMAIMLGRPIEKVTISPAQLQTGGRRLGLCKVQKGRSKPSKDELEDDVLIMLAGMVAEGRITGRYCQAAAGQDLRTVERLLANRAKTERQLDRLIRRSLDKAEHLLAADIAAKAVELIANEVLQRETISGRSVRQLYQQAEQKFS
jgi:ATP-dependent Zn protease